jgi:hypothetical protein
MKFTEFVAAIGYTLTPGQLAIALVVYDGLEPIDLPPELRELGRQIFGPVDRFPPEARHVVVIVAGRAGGKTLVFSSLRAVHLAVTLNLDALSPGESAYATIVSDDPRQRRQCYEYALGAVESCPDLAAMVEGEAGAEQFVLRRPDGKSVMVESVPPKRGGGSLRARSFVFVAMEEAGFFQDSSHVASADDSFTAANARMLPGAQMCLSSTPYLEEGLLYTEFVENHPDPSCAGAHLTNPGHPHRAIAAHAPTLVLREAARSMVEGEQARNPENSAREHGAQFVPIGASQLFDPIQIAASVDHSLVLGRAPRLERTARTTGFDLGFIHDAATAVSVERDPEFYAVLDYVEIFAKREKLKPSQVLTALGQVAHEAKADEMVGDGHAAPFAGEAFVDGMNLALVRTPEGNEGKRLMFGVTRDLMNEGKLRLPNDARLLQQLREVKKRPLPGGGYRIDQPRKAKGGHGDIVSALVAACWRLHVVGLPEAPPGPETPDPALAAFRARVREIREGIPHESTRGDARSSGSRQWVSRDWRRR